MINCHFTFFCCCYFFALLIKQLLLLRLLQRLWLVVCCTLIENDMYSNVNHMHTPLRCQLIITTTNNITKTTARKTKHYKTRVHFSNGLTAPNGHMPMCREYIYLYIYICVCALAYGLSDDSYHKHMSSAYYLLFPLYLY